MLKTNLFSNPRKLFYFTMATTLVIRLLVAAFLPIIGDEAYFILWARNPDYGYYDHTPMVGWMLTALLSISDHPLWLRLPTVLILTLTGWVIYRLLRDRDPDSAAYAGIFYLLMPVNVIGVLVLTDTPLILWSFLSALAFYQSQRQDSYGWYVLAGLFLGLAFYSKYFAVLLGFTYLFYLLLFVRRGVRPYIGLLLLVLACLPFVILNLVWNYYHCWDNYLFNLFNRTQGTHWSSITLLKYLGWLLYLITPPVLYYIVRQYRQTWRKVTTDKYGIFLLLFLLPILMLLFISTWKSVGLHWLFSFLPMLAMGLVVLLDARQFRICCYFMLPYSMLHVIAIFILLAFSHDIFRNNEGVYQDIVFGFEQQEILAQLKPYLDDYRLATTSYSESALLSYSQRKHVLVLGNGSYHGRQDDLLTDFRKLNGGDIIIFDYNDSVKKYSRYFEKFDVYPMMVKGMKFYYALGQGFKYSRYHTEVLVGVMNSFYKIPDGLPVGACYMFDRYAAE